jgi:predicted GNAT family acetyltransferase
MTHTEVPPEFEGKGVGSQLVKGALEIVKNDGKRVRPLCTFVAAYIKRHPEYQPLAV